jgi:hypothetical protein
VKSGVGVAVRLLCATSISAAACTTKDSTDVDPSALGGSGGSPLDSGAAGGGGNPTDAGGAGGSMDADVPDADVPDAALPRFQAVLEGLSVAFTPLDPVWINTCNEPNPRIAQRSGDSWTLLEDDRPENLNLQHEAHYLDGDYQSECRLSLGCDVGGCRSFADALEDELLFQSHLVAREFVQVGELPAPTCETEDAGIALDAGDDAGLRSIPAIESRAPTGPLALRLRYFRDSQCQTEELTAYVEVE